MFNGSYYNPYMFQPYSQAASGLTGVGAISGAKTGLGIKGLFKSFNFNNFLTSTGKTLNVINQAIPIFYQVKPIVSNAKTMLRVAGALKGNSKENKSSMNTSQITPSQSVNISNNNSFNNTNSYSTSSNQNVASTVNSNPTFFL